MDIAAFANAVVAGVPLLFVVIGLVQFTKKLGATGKVLIIISMAIGLLLGAGFQFATVGFPVNFAGWFGVIVYGLGLGIVASGAYDAVTTAIRAAK